MPGEQPWGQPEDQAPARSYAPAYARLAAATSGRPGSRECLSAELHRLATLHGDGALSDEEFVAAKRQLLG